MAAWDEYTIRHEPVSSIDLMERAAKKCFDWIETRGWKQKSFSIFCGRGNNGGDGLAIARMLALAGYRISVNILYAEKQGSPEFIINLKRLIETPNTSIHYIKQEEDVPVLPIDGVVIDALFGSGLNKPVDGVAAGIVNRVNRSISIVVAMDVPSGLFLDSSSISFTIIKARYTLSFQCYKMALLVQENASFIGQVVILDIGLHPGFTETLHAAQVTIDRTLIQDLYKPRNAFSHKGNFGHALLITGSLGKIGAGILATLACCRTGAGLTTVFLPKCGYTAMQTAVPEAMALTDSEEEYLSGLPEDVEKYNAVGLGPGIGTKEETRKMVTFMVRRYKKPLVIDADGLNCIAEQKSLLEKIPPLSILTPHPKEFERLFGKFSNDFERMEEAKRQSKFLNCIIVLKGHHTQVALPGGMNYFNTSGNAGMAKGGSGDVLTGMITSFLAQGYPPEQAALMGVYLHGWAGDLAEKHFSTEAMLPGDIIYSLPAVFKSLHSGTAT